MFSDADRATLTALATKVARLDRLSPRYVRDKDDAAGAIYVVGDGGLTRRWVSDGNRMANLLNTFPIVVEDWAGADVADIPLVGPAPR